MRRDTDFRTQFEGGLTAAIVDVSPLQTILSDFGAQMEPLFGIAEDTIRANLDATAAAAEIAGAEPSDDLEMDTYYAVAAPDTKLDETGGNHSRSVRID